MGSYHENWIQYGKEKISLNIPEEAIVYEIMLPYVEADGEPLSKISYALSHPYGKGLESILSPGKKVCIISDDITRPTPVSLIMKILIPMLESRGIAKKDINIAMALGSHWPMTQHELILKLGNEIFDNYQVNQPSFSRDDEYVMVTETQAKKPISIFRPVVESDIRIGIGNIVPHNTLGWSGGAKILFPGVASKDSVANFHTKAAIQSDPVFGNDINIVREEVESWTRAFGLHFIINTILNRKFSLVDCVAGDFVLAHRAGIEKAKKIYEVPFDKRADLVIVDADPAFMDFWQGTKGLNAGNLVVKDGGEVFLFAPCYEGIGPHPEYPFFLGRRDPNTELEKLLKTGCGNLDPLAIAIGSMISKMHSKFKMSVYTDGMNETELESAGIEKISNINEHIKKVCGSVAGTPIVAIIRNGAEILPKFL